MMNHTPLPQIICLFAVLMVGCGQTNSVSILSSPFESTISPSPSVQVSPSVGQRNTPTASLDHPISIQLNQRISIPSEGLDITFLKVEQDSRCPSDTTCVWAGQATILLNIVKDEQDLSNIMVSIGAGQNSTTIVNDRYSIELIDLAPYPSTTQPIDPDQYTATLLVSRL